MLVAGWCHVAADTRGVTIYSSSSLTSEWSLVSRETSLGRSIIEAGLVPVAQRAILERRHERKHLKLVLATHGLLEDAYLMREALGAHQGHSWALSIAVALSRRVEDGCLMRMRTSTVQPQSAALVTALCVTGPVRSARREAVIIMALKTENRPPGTWPSISTGAHAQSSTHVTRAMPMCS